MKKRKAYQGPKTVSLNTMRVARNQAAALTPEERGVAIREARGALNQLRQGRATRQDWSYLADAANVGEALSDLGICSDADSRRLLKAMQTALGAIARRVNDRGTWTTTGPELTAVAEGLARHEIQLEHCSLAELRQAVVVVERRARAAREGQLTAVDIVELNPA